jgi:Ca2+-binding RTX toxin-like protein
MVALGLPHRHRALPVPVEQDPRDPGQRPAPRRAPAPAERRPRANFDSLAIGAPLTAALVGVLLADGEGALAVPGLNGDGAGGATAANRIQPGTVVTSHPGVAAVQLDGPSNGAAETFSASASDAVDPVAPSAAAAAPETAEEGAAGGLAAPPAGAITAGSESVVGGPINISLASSAPLDDLALDAAAGAGAGASPDHRIGDTITGTDGDDVIHGTPYNDHLFGGAGNDTIYGYEGDDLLDGGSGDDRLFGGPGDDRLLGGRGNDELFGGTGDDTLSGGLGRDHLFGEEGRDWLDGGPGDDLLDGGPGADRLIGGAGDDRLVVDHLHDVALESGRGADGGGNDLLEVAGGFANQLPDGVDRVTFVLSENLSNALPSGAATYRQQVGSEIEHVTLKGDADHDIFGDSKDNHLTGNLGDNHLYGEGGDDVLDGGAGDDVLGGDSGNDRLNGGSGDDLLMGGSGRDELHGGAGDDLLDGGRGADLLYGGAGNDTFVIGLNDSAVDTVFDHDDHNRLTIEGGDGHLTQTAVVGDDLYVVVDHNPVAIVDGYLGNEAALEGIDTGDGVRSADNYMAPGAGARPALAATAAPRSSLSADDDLLGGYLSRPSHTGTFGADRLLGSSEADWLSGGADNDHLVGNGGRDVLEGGAGNDVLDGGGGDDRYLIRAGDTGWDVIRDTEGSNVVELDGFAGAHARGVVAGKDLIVVVDSSPVFTFENFVGNEHALAGVQIGDELLSADDLLS